MSDHCARLQVTTTKGKTMTVYFISYTTPADADVVRVFASESAWDAAWLEVSKMEGITNLWADTTEMEG